MLNARDLRAAISINGGTPASYDTVALLRQLVTVYGGTPTQYSPVMLLRQAVTALGGTPTQWSIRELVRELLATLGVLTTNMNPRSLSALLAATPTGPTLPVITRAFYVAANGSDAAAGTSPATAWATIAKVNAAALVAGDVVLFRGGDTFAGTLTPVISGSAGSRIGYGSYGGGRATINGGANRAISSIDNHDIIIKGLNTVGSGGTSDGVYFGTTASGTAKLQNITIADMDISGHGGSGVSVAGGNGTSGYNNILIEGISAHDNTARLAPGGGTAGIMVQSANGYYFGASAPSHTNIVIRNCIAYNNPGIADVNWTGSGIFAGQCQTAEIYGCEAYNNGTAANGSIGIWVADCRDVRIHHCYSHHNKSTGNDGGGFDLDGGAVNCTMEYNVSYANAGYGYMDYAYDDPPIAANSGNVIRFNLSIEDQDGGLFIATDGAAITGSKVYNNTVRGGGPALIVGGAVTSLVANNILDSTVAVSTLSRAIPTNTTISGNLHNGTYKWGAPTYAALALWRSASGQETYLGANSAKSGSPGFVNAAGITAPDFKLTAGSVAIAGGRVLSTLGITAPALDYFGAATNETIGFSASVA